MGLRKIDGKEFSFEYCFTDSVDMSKDIVSGMLHEESIWDRFITNVYSGGDKVVTIRGYWTMDEEDSFMRDWLRYGTFCFVDSNGMYHRKMVR